MDDAPDSAARPEDFRQSAAPAPPQDRVTLPIDADVLTWLRAGDADWQGQVNGLLRFYMDSSIARETAFEPDAFEPGEMVQDPPLPLYELEFA